MTTSRRTFILTAAAAVLASNGVAAEQSPGFPLSESQIRSLTAYTRLSHAPGAQLTPGIAEVRISGEVPEAEDPDQAINLVAGAIALDLADDGLEAETGIPNQPTHFSDPRLDYDYDPDIDQHIYTLRLNLGYA